MLVIIQIWKLPLRSFVCFLVNHQALALEGFPSLQLPSLSGTFSWRWTVSGLLLLRTWNSLPPLQSVLSPVARVSFLKARRSDCASDLTAYSLTLNKSFVTSDG